MRHGLFSFFWSAPSLFFPFFFLFFVRALTNSFSISLMAVHFFRIGQFWGSLSNFSMMVHILPVVCAHIHPHRRHLSQLMFGFSTHFFTRADAGEIFNVHVYIYICIYIYVYMYLHRKHFSQLLFDFPLTFSPGQMPANFFSILVEPNCFFIIFLIFGAHFFPTYPRKYARKFSLFLARRLAKKLKRRAVRPGALLRKSSATNLSTCMSTHFFENLFSPVGAGALQRNKKSRRTER